MWADEWGLYSDLIGKGYILKILPQKVDGIIVFVSPFRQIKKATPLKGSKI